MNKNSSTVTTIQQTWILQCNCDCLSNLNSIFQAAIGIANLIVMAMEEEGATAEEALSKIWMVDSRGLIVKVRMENSMIKQEPKNSVE